MDENQLNIRSRKHTQFYDQNNDVEVSLRSRVNALEQSVATIKATTSILLADKKGDHGLNRPSPSSFINNLMSVSEKEVNQYSMMHIKTDELSRKYNKLEKELQSVTNALNATIMRAVSLKKSNNTSQITDSDIETMFEVSNGRNKRAVAALTNKMNVCLVLQI